MKKLLIILAIVAIASTRSFAYTHYGYVSSDNPPSYQNHMTYTTLGSWPGPLAYQLYVDCGNAYIGTNVGYNSLSSQSQSTKYGSFTGAFNYCYISACGYIYNGHWGYAWVSASW